MTTDVRYVTVDELSASLTDVHVLDEGLADWACTTVTALAASITRRAWSADAVPPPVRAICGLAARRLYANPDRFTRENTPEYGYALDASVTSADIFTPSEVARLRTYAPAATVGGLRVVSTTRGDLAPDYGVRW